MHAVEAVSGLTSIWLSNRPCTNWTKPYETRFLDGFEKLHKYIREHGHSIIRKIEDLSYFTLYDLLKKYNFRAEAV